MFTIQTDIIWCNYRRVYSQKVTQETTPIIIPREVAHSFSTPSLKLIFKHPNFFTLTFLERVTRQTDYMARNVEKFACLLWKWGWEAMGLSFKKDIFSTENFFAQALRKFSIHHMTMFNIFNRYAQHNS